MKAVFACLAIALAVVAFLSVAVHKKSREIAALTDAGIRMEARMKSSLAELRERERELYELKASVATTAQPPQPSPADVVFENELEVWLGKVRKLGSYLEKNPNRNIPQMDLLTANEWLDATKGKLETDADFREALGKLRGVARQKIAKQVGDAIMQAIQANGGRTPEDLRALAPFLPANLTFAVDQLILNPSGKIDGLLTKQQYVIVDKAIDIWDATLFYSPDGNWGSRSAGAGASHSAVERAVATFTESHGTPPISVSQSSSYPGVDKIEELKLRELFRAVTIRP